MTLKDVRLALMQIPMTESEMKEIVGYNLRVLRESEKVSRKELATRLNKAVNTIDAMENGRIFPKIPTLIELAFHYGKSVDEILGTGFDYETKLKQKNRIERAVELFSKYGKVEHEDGKVFYIFTINKLEICNGELHEVNKSVKFTDVTLVRFVELLTDEALATNKTFEQLLNEKIAGLSDDKID